MHRRQANASVGQAQEQPNQSRLVGDGQGDRKGTRPKVAGTGFASGVNQHRTKDTKREISTDNHIVRDRIFNLPGVNVGFAWTPS